MNCRIEFNTIFYQFHEIPLNQNLIDFLFVPEKYFGSWVLISVNAKVISFFRSSGENVRCRIEFMMILGNSLESKCDHHKLYCLLGQSKHRLLEYYDSLSQLCIFFFLTLVFITDFFLKIKNMYITLCCAFWLYHCTYYNIRKGGEGPSFSNFF